LTLSRAFALFALLAWTALLATPVLDGPAGLAVGAASLSELRSVWSAASFLARLLAHAAVVAIRFAPLGALAVLVLADRPSRIGRAVLVFAPAVALALVLAWLALGARAGESAGPFQLVVPLVGIVFGALAGLAWRRGFWASILFLPKAVAYAFVLVMLAGTLAVLSLEPAAALPEPKPLASSEKRHLVELFRSHNPREVPDGETRTLELSGAELDRALSFVASSSGLGVRTSVELLPGGLAAAASLPVPRTSRWLNLRVAGHAAVDGGRLSADPLELRVGRFQVPEPLLRLAAPLLVAGLEGDRDVRHALASVRRLSFSAERATLGYTRFHMPRGFLARVLWGEEASGAARAGVYEHVDRLLEGLPAVPAGEARFARALELAFGAARERSQAGSAVEENRQALLALGIVLGHPRLARSVGERLDEERTAETARLLPSVRVRGRADWSRHFAVSAALTVLSAVAPSDAAGLLKEELDAEGGSGFSFGDLLADRAGSTFAEVATRDEASARRIQDRLAGGFRVDDFFPEAADLPEGIADAELQSRYGGVGGPLYRETADDVERRVRACPAYQ
jgi:hypothetical protein